MGEGCKLWIYKEIIPMIGDCTNLERLRGLRMNHYMIIPTNYSLVMTNTAMVEMALEIVSLPMKHGEHP